VLAAPERLAAGWGMVSHAPGDPEAIMADRCSESLPGDRRQFECASGKRGQLTGPNPTDRGKRGSKHHLLVDAGGIPLVVGLSGANVPDVITLEYLVSNLPHIGGRRGPPAHKPDRLHADKGYASKKNRRFLTKIGVKCRIARKGIESAAHLGRHRWVVERTIAWFHRFKRLRTRYERNAETHMAFMLLAAALICWRQVTGKGL
jgi:transposase